MGFTKTLTEKQHAANIANAQKSTGPKSPEGKHNSSQNAVTHGFLARSILLPGESSDRFHALLASYAAHFRPASQDEYDLVETMAACRWRILRNWTFESSGLIHKQRQQGESTAHEEPPIQGVLAWADLQQPPHVLESLGRHEVRLDRAYHRAADRLRRIQADRASLENKEALKRSHDLIENKEASPNNEPKRTVNEPQTNPEQTLDKAA